MVVKLPMFVSGCAQGLGILPSVLKALNIQHERFVLEFTEFSTKNGNIFKTAIYYIKNQSSLILEKSDMLEFINDNIMYFVLGQYNISINILQDNILKTFGIFEKNIFILQYETTERKIEYYPTFV